MTSPEVQPIQPAAEYAEQVEAIQVAIGRALAIPIILADASGHNYSSVRFDRPKWR